MNTASASALPPSAPAPLRLITCAGDNVCAEASIAVPAQRGAAAHRALWIGAVLVALVGLAMHALVKYAMGAVIGSFPWLAVP